MSPAVVYCWHQGHGFYISHTRCT